MKSAGSVEVDCLSRHEWGWDDVMGHLCVDAWVSRTSSSRLPAAMSLLGSSQLSTVTLKPQPSRRILNNAKTDVIATIETLPDVVVKYLFRLVYVSVFFGVVGVAALLTVKLGYPSKLKSNSVLIWNATIASIGIVALGTAFACYLHRIYVVRSRGMRWSARRLKGAILIITEVTTQLINLTFYLVPNVYLLVHPCGWTDMILTWSGLVRLTCWNTIFLLFLILSHVTNLVNDAQRQPNDRLDASIFDKSLIYHAPKLMLWIITEGFLFGISIYLQVTNDSSRFCTGDDLGWHPDDTIDRMTVGIAVCFIAYFLGSGFYFKNGLDGLKDKQYLNYRMANIMIRLQLRLQMIVHTFHLVSFALLWFVKMHTQASFVLSWLGFLPSQFAMTVIDIVKLYLLIPLRPANEDFILQNWLREYSWSEEELPQLKQLRGDGTCSMAPMFCFERAVKTLYWSTFIYDFKQVPNSKFSLKTAMHLYDLTEYELFHESEHDTKLLVAWNSKMVLLAFRGTSSMKNILADLRISRIPHPPIRGSFLATPLVHRGFLQTWHSNGLNHRVLELLRSIIKNDKDFEVLLTGHSLGGALATLAAYDIRTQLDVPPCKIDCYTFGAPRVGNYAFAHDYNALVPNTWHIINDQDYITRTMKLLVLYKRPGQRVIVNASGDMLVRPSFIEMSLSRKTGAINLAHHLLGNYERAFLAIVRLQFSEDSIEGGFEGMLKIGNILKHVLGVSRARLIQELSWGDRIKALEKQKKRASSKFAQAASGFRQLCTRTLEIAEDKLEAMKRRLQHPMQCSKMNGINPSTRLCGGKTCDVMALELTPVDGLGTEKGHVSLESQRTRNEKDMNLELQPDEEEDLHTIV